MNLIEVNRPQVRLPYAKSTIYKLHSLKRLPAVIFKVGGRLYFDLDRWQKLAEECREQNMAESARVYRTSSTR